MWLFRDLNIWMALFYCYYILGGCMFTVLSLIAEDFPVTKTHMIGNPFSASDIYVCTYNCSGFGMLYWKYWSLKCKFEKNNFSM